jgi:hypothetical protein
VVRVDEESVDVEMMQGVPALLAHPPDAEVVALYDESTLSLRRRKETIIGGYLYCLVQKVNW